MPPRESPNGAARKKSADRFATLNEFIDVGAMKAGLSVYGVAVWVFLWRHATGGVAQASVEQMTNSLGISRRSAFMRLRS